MQYVVIYCENFNQSQRLTSIGKYDIISQPLKVEVRSMDIKRKLAKIIAKKAIVMVIISILLAVCIIFLYEPKDHFYLNGSVALSLAILLIYFRASGLWRILRDKSWEGTVVDINCEEAREPVTYAHAIDRSWRGIPKIIKYTIITVEMPDGERRKLKFPCRELDVNVFRVGDEIVHHRGMKYPQNRSRAKEMHMCPLCGRFLGDNYCPDCRFYF